MLKTIASVIIMCGCTMIGILFSSSFKKRVRQLTEFENALSQLEYDIDFLSIPLEESFEKLSNCSEGAVKEFFSYIAYRLRTNKCCDMPNVWKRAFERFKYDLAVTDDDIAVLIDFSQKLGSGNKEKEKNNIKMALLRLSVALDEARNTEKSSTKMYRGLGLLLGIFIVVLLV